MVTFVTRDGLTGKIKSVEHVPNLITKLYHNDIAAVLRGNTANNNAVATYHAVGTGETAPADTDTQLETEIFRKLISVRTNTANIAELQTFFTTSEANGTIKEIGLFGGLATGTANSGTLFARLSVNRVKSSNDTLTLLHAIEIGA